MREINKTSYSQVTLDEINRQAKENPEEFAINSEEYYKSQLKRVAGAVKDSHGDIKIVLLCGPSGSSKTTTAHKLKAELAKGGVGSKVLTMDNFYRGIKNYTIAENGMPDMESVDTIDIELLNQCLREIISKGESYFPVFDFMEQRRLEEKEYVTLAEGDVLIMEGIHALNPHITENIPSENIFRMYVSVRTKFVDNGADVLRPSDIRLIRRMVRDNLFRGYPPHETIAYWDVVLEGERVNINPYRDDVEFKMDTTIDYEVCTWNALLADLLANIDLDEYTEYPAIARIVEGLPRFESLSPELIDKESIIREFIG